MFKSIVLLFNLITAVVIDEYGKMNDSLKLPVNGDMMAQFNNAWSLLDPEATQMIPQFKLLPFLKSIDPPIFDNPAEASSEIFKMNIAGIEGKRGLMVHYVDTLLALIRYVYVKKLGEEIGEDLDMTLVESPELTKNIVHAYPHLKALEKMEPKDFKQELAATKMQNIWQRRVATQRISAVRIKLEREVARCRGVLSGDPVPADISTAFAEDLMKEMRRHISDGTSSFDVEKGI